MSTHITGRQLTDEIETARKRIDELKRAVEHHRFQYYVLDRPEVLDSEFDELFHELEALEQKFPELATPDSPTQKVGAPPSTEFSQIVHRQAMLSLANAMNETELTRWEERLTKILVEEGTQDETLKYVSELKIDGLSITLTYRNGEFVEGATRGNGQVGEDVTLNLKTIDALPRKLKALDLTESDEVVIESGIDGSGEKVAATAARSKMPEFVEVRGEVYMPVSSFTALNESLLGAGDQPFANPRNAASGSLRQKDPRVTAKRKLSLWVYNLHIEDPQIRPLEHHSDSLAVLRQLGFPVAPSAALSIGIEEVKKYCQDWEEKRHQLDYQTDGVVIKLDDTRLWKLAGATSHSPRWAVAFKYPPEEAETVLESVEFEVGRTGAVTPVANLKPVKLAGTTVKRASLHNADQIQRLGVHIGDTVVVRKAGEIIPEVLSVKLERRPADAQPVVYPETCPVCDTTLVRHKEEVALRCPNTYGCRSQKERRIKHWVSRDAMDIEGVGGVLVKQLIEKGLVERPSDLYKLTVEQVSSLERMGAKSAQNVIKGIEASKTKELANLIYAFGIRHVGVMVAELIAGRFFSIDELSSAKLSDIAEIDGVGPTIAEAVVEFFAHPDSIQTVEGLRESGVKLERSADEADSGPQSNVFEGMTFVITGTLETMDRTAAEKAIKSRGGKATSSVSKKTNYLVCGASPGSKLAKAQTLGVKVLNEDEFKALLDS